MKLIRTAKNSLRRSSMLPLWMVNKAAAIWLIAFAKQWMLLQCPKQKHIQITLASCLKITVFFGKDHQRVNLSQWKINVNQLTQQEQSYFFTLNLVWGKPAEVQISLLNTVEVTMTWQRSLWLLQTRKNNILEAYLRSPTLESIPTWLGWKDTCKQDFFKLIGCFFSPLCKQTDRHAQTTAPKRSAGTQEQNCRIANCHT